MKIIHLSDLHIGYVAGKWNCENRARAIVDSILEKCTPANDYIVAITGDIVDKGKNHKQVNSALDIISALNNGGIRCIILPGNHDYGSGLGISIKHQTYFKNRFYGNANEEFPRLTIFDQTAFISLDSLQGEFDLSGNILSGIDDLTGGADGAIGPNQLTRLRAILASEQVKSCIYTVVMLHHHPIYKAAGFLELKDSKSLVSVLEEFDIDMLLFGHKHGGDELTSRWGIPRIYDGGSSTGKDMEIPSLIRVFDLSKPPGHYSSIPWQIPT